MIILVNGRFLARPTTGVERYAREAVRALERLAPDLALEIVAPSNARPTEEAGLARIRSGGSFGGQVWEQLELPRIAAGRPLLNLCNLAPLACSRQVTVIHDAAVFEYPQGFSPQFRRYYRAMLPLVAQRSRRIVTVSNFSRAALAANLKLEESAIAVAPPGATGPLAASPASDILERFRLGAGEFVLAVGSHDPRKNLAGVFAAASRLPDVCFAVAGGFNPAVFATERPLVLPANVVLLGYVSDGELSALYQSAGCFVFPSFYEGFGLPPLEAMACGCPTVVASTSSLPEACGDAALYCDPTDPDDIAHQIRCLLHDAALRQRAIERGRQRARRFRWERTAEVLRQVLREAFGT